MKQELVQVQELGIREKMLNVVSALRNNKDVTQGRGALIENDKMCVMGLLGYRAGIPKEDLMKQGGTGYKVWAKYGFESMDVYKINLGDIETREPTATVRRNTALGSIFGLNDAGYTFDQIADFIETRAISPEPIYIVENNTVKLK